MSEMATTGTATAPQSQQKANWLALGLVMAFGLGCAAAEAGEAIPEAVPDYKADAEARCLAFNLGYAWQQGRLAKTRKQLLHVKHKAGPLGRGRARAGNRGEWSQAELRVVSALEGELPRAAMADFLGRPVSGIDQRLYRARHGGEAA